MPSTLTIQSILSKTKEIVVTSSVEVGEKERMLQEQGYSYHIRIRKHKKRGREFVITLLEAAQNG